jgi:hypothetical protein
MIRLLKTSIILTLELPFFPAVLLELLVLLLVDEFVFGSMNLFCYVDSQEFQLNKYFLPTNCPRSLFNSLQKKPDEKQKAFFLSNEENLSHLIFSINFR